MASPVEAHAVPDALFIVTIPAGCQYPGLEFEGVPPRITHVDSKSPVREQVATNYDSPTYVHVVSLPDVEVTNFASSKHLTEILLSNSTNKRRLFVSSTPHFVDTTIGHVKSGTGAIYKHSLPCTNDVGIRFVRFPPIVEHVNQDSPLAGRILPGQTVQALIVPGHERFDLESGGFRSEKLNQNLRETANIEGRLLVVKDAPHAAKEKGTSKAFVVDDCAVM